MRNVVIGLTYETDIARVPQFCLAHYDVWRPDAGPLLRTYFVEVRHQPSRQANSRRVRSGDCSSAKDEPQVTLTAARPASCAPWMPASTHSQTSGGHGGRWQSFLQKLRTLQGRERRARTLLFCRRQLLVCRSLSGYRWCVLVEGTLEPLDTG